MKASNNLGPFDDLSPELAVFVEDAGKLIRSLGFKGWHREGATVHLRVCDSWGTIDLGELMKRPSWRQDLTATVERFCVVAEKDYAGINHPHKTSIRIYAEAVRRHQEAVEAREAYDDFVKAVLSEGANHTMSHILTSPDPLKSFVMARRACASADGRRMVDAANFDFSSGPRNNG